MSSVLFDVIFAARSTSTHHKLALDALRFLRGEVAERWRNLFLHFHETYLAGSKAPDDVFKDFRNHVLHVGDGYWGGATKAAEDWYDRTVDAFARQSWEEGVYNAGVLSHYFTDPFQPLHTAQCEAEGTLHRACEWSIAKSYGELQHILEEDLGGYPAVEAPDAEGWLTEMIRAGARGGFKHYRTTMDHYDLRKGVKDPPAGLDQTLKDAVAGQIGQAVVGFARVLEVAFEDSATVPPEYSVTLAGFLATLNVPIYWITRKLSDAKERALVESMYAELQESGKVVRTLTADDQTIRQLYAQEVLKVPVARLDSEMPEPTGTEHGSGEVPRSRASKIITGQPRLAEVAETLLPELSSTGKKTLSNAAAPQRPEPDTSQRPALQTTSEQRTVSPASAQTPVRPATPPASKPLNNPAVASQTTQPERVSNPIIPNPFPSKAAAPRPGESRPNVARPNDTRANESPTAPTRRIEPSHPSNSAPEETLIEARRTLPTQPLRAAELDSGEISRTNIPSTNRTDRRDDVERKPAREKRFNLELDSPVADGPSIGPKTADRLSVLNVRTVRDLLKLVPANAAAKLNNRFITADIIKDWQAQARLVCMIPELYGHDAQILVACGIREAEHLHGLDPRALFTRVEAFCDSPAGERVLRSSKRPDLAEVTFWIDQSQDARVVSAA